MSEAPKMFAYVDGNPAGWRGSGLRFQMGRLGRSRTIPLVDERPVWSVVCFNVEAPYRPSGWNCEAPDNSSVSSFDTTICVLERHADYERVAGAGTGSGTSAQGPETRGAPIQCQRN